MQSDRKRELLILEANLIATKNQIESSINMIREELEKYDKEERERIKNIQQAVNKAMYEFESKLNKQGENNNE